MFEAHLGPVHTESSLPEPGEKCLRIALSCTQTHCIRTPSNRGSKVSKLEIWLRVGVCMHAIPKPNRIAPRDRLATSG